MRRFELAIASLSNPGKRAANEDALCTGEAGSTTFAVLSDGAGGHARGAEASSRAVAAIEAALRGAGAFEALALRTALRGAHAEIERRQRQAKGRDRMHATAVALWIDGRHDLVLWSHVGDSRLYRLRYGVIDRLTVDDSVVQRMVDGGVLTAQQAETHPMKNQLLAALGMHGPLDPRGPGAPDPLVDGDVFLLCTDGWWSALTDAEIAATWVDADTPEAWLAAMRRLIEARALPDQDNYSAIAVCVSDPQEDTQALEGD